MFRIDFIDLNNAAEIMYCFMTLPSLTRPECTIWSDAGFPDTLTNDGPGFMSEKEFCSKITSSNFSAITCIASTDKQDKRRVVLNLMPDTEYLVLNFPSSGGRLNPDEKKLLALLE